eukprot:1743982-Rhodomonas_salina.4
MPLGLVHVHLRDLRPDAHKRVKEFGKCLVAEGCDRDGQCCCIGVWRCGICSEDVEAGLRSQTLETTGMPRVST